jgi:hypothetical protein
MASTPNAYSTSSVTRAGTLISELNIVVPRTALEFFKKYNFTSYMLLTQLSGGMIPIKNQSTENKQFYHYEDFGRDMGFVTVDANFTSSGVGTAATFTVASGGYSVSGTRSIGDVNMVLYNSRTGVEVYITAVNKATPNAHTYTIKPVVASQDAGGLAGDQMLSRGYKYVGEGSDYTTTIVKNIAKYINYVTEHRKDAKITDLATMERIDFPYNGQHFYTYKLKDDFKNAFWQEEELLLLDSNLTDNLSVTESGTLGMKQWIAANGITYYYSSFNVQSTFADIDRRLDFEGAPMSYDWLQDIYQNKDVANAIANEFPNGAIVYDINDLRRGFKKFTPYAREYNFQSYLPISNPAMYGTSTATDTDNTGYLIPTGRRTLNGDVNKNDVPQLIKRYMAPKGMPIYMWETGGLSENGKTTKAELVLSQISYPGLDMLGSNQFMRILKG